MNGLGRAAWVPVAMVLLASCGTRPPDTGPVAASQNHGAIPRYGIFELSLKHDTGLANPFFDASTEAEFHSPDGRTHHIKGFYYGRHIWMVRFRPDTRGHWQYRYTFRAGKGRARSGTGSFETTGADDPLPPVHRNPEDPYRWVTVTGAPYFPVGLEDCIENNGAHIGKFTIDGEGRNDEFPSITAAQYLSTYGRAGFNLLRFSQRNCSYLLYSDLDHYLETESLATDELLSTAHQSGMRVMYGIFGYHAQWYTGESSGKVLHYVQGKLGLLEEGVTGGWRRGAIEKEKRFIDYSVARWGVYVDFWELLNERRATDSWTALTARYLQSVDPDHKPVTTSYEKPAIPEIAINSPHWYSAEKESDSDLVVECWAREWKRFGKPVIVGEHGNMGMNWDPKSALRMRVRLWTALFHEIDLVFWNTSWSKYGMNGGVYKPGTVANIYLGPEERGYVEAFQRFASRLDSHVRPAPVSVSMPQSVRAYALESDATLAVYLHHYADHETAERGCQVSFTAPAAMAAAEAQWIDPATGSELGRVTIRPGWQSIEAPPVKVDLALLLSRPGTR